MAKAIRRHIRVGLSADQSIPDEILTTVLFDSVKIDTRSIFNSASPGLLMVPNSSYTHVVLTANLAWSANPTGDQWLTILKNGSLDAFRGAPATFHLASTMERPRHNAMSALIQVSSGDYFELQAWCNLGPDDVIMANNTWFEMELWAGSEDFAVSSPGGGGGGAAAAGNYFRFFPGHSRRVFPTSALRRFPRA